MVETAEVQRPDSEEVVVRVAAAGVNFADMLVVTGQYQFPPQLPASPGNEFSGVVESVGAGVGRVAPGDRVMGLVPHGAFAERVVTPERLVVRVPDGLDLLSAAATPVSYSTAHAALVAHGRVREGQSVVVTGAGGSVGHATVDVARRLGAAVIGIENGRPSGDSATDHTLLVQEHGGDALPKRIRELTGGRGADLAVDVVGGDLFEGLTGAMRFGGTVLTIGFASGSVPEINLARLLTGNFGVAGFDLGTYMREHLDYLAAALAEISEWTGGGAVHPRYDQVVPMAEAPEVLSRVQRGEARGKTVLRNPFEL